MRFVAAILSGVVLLFPFAAGAGLALDPLRRRRTSPDGENGPDDVAFVRVGPLDLLPADGVPRLFVLTADRNDAWTRSKKQRIGAVFLSRDDAEDGPRVSAFSAVCPHLGCTIDYDASSAQFECPCHQAAFATDGSRLSGPSKRGLDPLEVELRREFGVATIYVAPRRFRPAIAQRTPIA